MRIDDEAFARYAKAEKELCEMAGTVLTGIIKEIEIRHGIRIAELRVTMDGAEGHGWPAANCVMVREEDVQAADQTKIAARESPASRYAPGDGTRSAMPHVYRRYGMAWGSGSKDFVAG